MAKKASEQLRYYKNQNGPMIGTVSRKILEKDGLYFKDIDGSGEFKEFDDWRLPAKDRARAYVKELTAKEKLHSFLFLTGEWENIQFQVPAWKQKALF